MTKIEAENLIKEQPEVKSRLNTLTVNAEDRYDDYWYVRVAEVVDDGEIDGQKTGHTSTFNWYKVNKGDGKVICSMFSYDKNGTLTKASSNSDCI